MEHGYDAKVHLKRKKDESSIGAVKIMKTTKIKNIFGIYKKKLQKVKIFIEKKTTFDFSDTKKILFSNVKDFTFKRYICEMYILADIK